jgi:hypothetical protein
MLKIRKQKKLKKRIAYKDKIQYSWTTFSEFLLFEKIGGF